MRRAFPQRPADESVRVIRAWANGGAVVLDDLVGALSEWVDFFEGDAESINASDFATVRLENIDA